MLCSWGHYIPCAAVADRGDYSVWNWIHNKDPTINLNVDVRSFCAQSGGGWLWRDRGFDLHFVPQITQEEICLVLVLFYDHRFCEFADQRDWDFVFDLKG